MTDQPLHTPDPDREALRGLFWDYLQGELSPEAARSLEQALAQNPEAAADCKDLIELAVMTRELCQRGGEARQVLADTIRDGMDDSGTHDVLAELARLEGQATATLVRLNDEDAEAPVFSSRGYREESMSPREVLSISGYLIGRALRSRPALVAYAAGVVLLAAVLLIPWGGTPSPQTAHQPQTTTSPQAAPVAVATLTAQHDARWAAFGPAPGDTLFAGQRLTLTAGFAEITTARGAVAVLEAPASIELSTHDNAIELRSGRLVGICETQPSKGFIVRTPHLDITDLGTRFGVAVTPGEQVITKVFEGTVAVRSSNSGSRVNQPILLHGGTSYAVDRFGDAIEQDDFDSDFAALAGHLSGVVSLNGQVMRSSIAIADLGEIAKRSDDEKAVIVQDRVRHGLKQPLPVTFAGTGRYEDFVSPHQSDVIKTGTKITAHILCLGTKDSASITNARGTVSFASEILGVISSPVEYKAYRTAVGSELGLAAGSFPEGGGNGGTSSDFIVISEDRRSLEFSFNAGGGAADAVIILVRNE